MTQEDKELLFQDLSARLPYRVIAVTIAGDVKGRHADIAGVMKFGVYLGDDHYVTPFDEISYYLRPLSSMTEEENNEWRDSWFGDLLEATSVVYPKSEEFLASSHSKSIDWLNKHHFDYNGLIPKGLALEALEGMYKTE